MKLERYIANSIFNYPSLYSRSNYNDSRILVLNQLFLVCGSGIEYQNPKNEIGKGYFDLSYKKERKYKLSTRDCKRLTNGEKIVEMYNKLCPKMQCLGMVWSDIGTKEEILFYSDFLSVLGKGKICVHKGDKIDKNLNSIDYVIEVYPPEKNPYEFYPYPFSIDYTPMWGRVKKKLISKDLIADDWRKGIVEIYTIAQQWFENDEKFSKDNYYNWSAFKIRDDRNYFLKAWDEQPDKLNLCKDYKIKPKNYTFYQEMADDIVKNQRARYISNCKKIINHYK